MRVFARLIIFTILVAAVSLSLSVVNAQEPVTLDVWVYEGEDVFLPTVTEAFQAAYPHITVQITLIPEDEYITKIDTALLAGAPPDLGYLEDLRWQINGLLLPLDDVVAEQNITISDYNPGAFTGCEYEGSIYCIGTYTGAVLMFYNKDLFDAAGIAYPSATEPLTIDEYAEITRKLAVHSENLEERVWGGDAGPTYWWMDIANFVSEDGRTALGYVNDEATVHTHTVIADLIREGVLVTESVASQVTGGDLISTGKLATTITDNAVALPLLEATDIRWGAAVPPVEKDGDLPFVPVWSDGLVVFKDTDTPEEALLFAAFLATEGNRLRMEITGDLPLSMRMAEELDWAGDSEGRQEMLAAIQMARPALFVPNFFGVIRPIVEAYSGLMLEDGIPAQEAFDEMAPLVQENLDEAWVTWDQIQPAQ